MQEEFHGITHEDGSRDWQQLYGWGTINANIWLPSLSELVGYDSDTYDAGTGCCFSAMQGLNMSNNYYWVDKNGGTQFAYFKQYNQSSGGQKLWLACKQEQSWLRTPVQANATHNRTVESATSISWDTNTPATASHAVHPAV